MRMWQQRWTRTAADWLSLPTDALLAVSRVTCVDGREVVIENVNSLVRVAETEVEVDLGDTTLLVTGEKFVVTLVARREIHVQGDVRGIVYAPKGGPGR